MFRIVATVVTCFALVLSGAPLAGKGGGESVPERAGPGAPHLSYYYLFQEVGVMPESVEVSVEVNYTLEDGTYLGSDFFSWSGPADEEFHADQAILHGASAAITALGGILGWEIGAYLATLLLGLVPIQASVGVYATALGLATVAPYAGMAVGAFGAAY